MTKYGSSKNAEFDLTSLGLPANVAADLEEAAKHSLAVKTWSSYKPAERSLIMFCKQKKLLYQLPLEIPTLVQFIHWLVFEKGKKAATVNSYLAGIRKMHVIKGLPAPTLKTELVQMILAGRKNIEDAEKLRAGGSERQPVTPTILELIKARLRDYNAAGADKCTIWTACTLLFHGAFRGGELLSRSSSEFDPAFVLLRKDLLLVDEGKIGNSSTLQVKVKAPKERKDNRAVIVDVYQSDTSICPVRAYKKWQEATSGYNADEPAFRLKNGDLLTATLLNSILKERLAGYIQQRITTHSFRGGAASMLANLGYSDKEVKAVGRWSSRAVELYMKLPRTKRMSVAKKIRKFGMKEED